MDHKVWRGGYTPNVHVGGHSAPAALVCIRWKRKNGEQTESPHFLFEGDEAEVEFSPLRDLIVIPFTECEAVGRLLVIDHASVIMMGRVISVQHDGELLTEPQKLKYIGWAKQ